MTKFEKVELRLNEVVNDYGTISIKDLEKKYDASYSTIQRVLKRHNVITGNKKYKYKYIRDNLENFKKDYIDGTLKISELCKKYKCTESYIMSLALELGIKRKTLKEKYKYEIINDWKSKKMLNNEIANKYKISLSSLKNILIESEIDDVGKRYGRKYFFDENYFDVINNEHKAYWLGFIYADGSHNEKRCSLTITLKKEDDYILKEFYKDIKCEKSINYIFNKKYNKYYASASIRSKYLSKSLLRAGVMQDKSYKIKFPDTSLVSDELIRHFIRGYFDGDGCITIPKNISKTGWNIVGNYDFMLCMKRCIEKLFGYSVSINKHSKTNNIYKIGNGGRIKTQLFLDWLYKDSTIYLKRKYERYIKIKKYNEEINNDKKNA